jgi:G3E family GTPase
MSTSQIPVTVLTGFLGAGKTTLLNRILSENHGHKIAVIENEFGPEGVDHELLVREANEQIIELNNGCICCTVRGDLARILHELADKRANGKIEFERVIIETTGMANPGPVTQTFFMDEEVADKYLLDAVITVVDAKHGDETLTRQPEAQNQVGFADRLLLTKVDLVTDAERAALSARLMHMNPRAPIKAVHFGETPIDEILDIRGFNLSSVLDIDPHFLDDEHPDAHDHDEHNHAHGAHDHEHQHGHHQHAHDDAIKAFVFNAERPFAAAQLEEFLSAVVQVYGTDLLRYKGILWIDGSERRVVFQGVHMLMGSDLGRAWSDDEKRSSRMIFIGRNLPQDTIKKGLEHCLV